MDLQVEVAIMPLQDVLTGLRSRLLPPEVAECLLEYFLEWMENEGAVTLEHVNVAGDPDPDLTLAGVKSRLATECLDRQLGFGVLEEIAARLERELPGALTEMAVEMHLLTAPGPDWHPEVEKLIVRRADLDRSR